MLAVLSPTPSVSLAPVDVEMPVPDSLPPLPEEGMSLLKAEGLGPDDIAGVHGETSHLAVLAYTGGAFAALHASEWARDDLLWAQDRLGILSNVYGLLRPLDRVAGKTLKLDGRLQAQDDDRLRAFWKAVVSPALDHAVAGHRSPVVVNLAAGAYYDHLRDHPALTRRVINVEFHQEEGGGTNHIQAMDAEARGLMAEWIVRNRLEDVEALKRFDVDGYRFNEALSDGRTDTWIFTRPLPKAH